MGNLERSKLTILFIIINWFLSAILFIAFFAIIIASISVSAESKDQTFALITLYLLVFVPAIIFLINGFLLKAISKQKEDDGAD